MELFRSTKLLLPVFLGLFVIQISSHRSHTQAVALPGEYTTGELLIKFQRGASKAHEKLAQLGTEKIRDFSLLGWQHVRLPPGMSVAEGIASCRVLPGVEAVQPNFIYHIQATTNDPRFSELYGLGKIQAPTAWDTTMGSASVVVAVIDLGVDYNHEDLSANMWRNPGETGLDSLGGDKASNGVDDDGDGYVDDVYGVDTINHDSDPIDDAGHGSHVAGIIGAVGNNGKGVVGVNWAVSIMAIKSHDASGNGTSASVVEAFSYAAMMRRRGVNVRVTNSSWGGAPEAPSFDQALKDAIDDAGNAGILNVCAAGNSNSNNDVTPFYPASYDSASIVAVAASDQNDSKAGFSSYGLQSVDLAAPGVGILSTYRGSYAFLSGTSMAAPHVSGASALLCGNNPNLSVAQLKSILISSVDVLPQWNGLTVSGGRLNVARALQSFPTVVQIDDPGFFVRQQYLDFLDREPDAGGQAYWTNRVTECGSNSLCIFNRRIDVSAAFIVEPEFQETGYFVYRMYQASYGSKPVFAEFNEDRGQVVGGANLYSSKQAFAANWVQRNAFKQIYPDGMPAAEFVNKLFDTARLIPYTTERQQQIDAIQSTGRTRAQVLREVIELAEFRGREYNPAFVLMEYFGYLRRNPDQEGYDFWLNVLSNREPGNYRGMVCSFITSAEYQVRFSPFVTHANVECGQ